MNSKDFPWSNRRLTIESDARNPQMDPSLEEILASANTDHVFERGTGDFDFLIESLTQSLREPKNRPFLPEILTAIQRLKSVRIIDPVRAETRIDIRGFLNRELFGNLGDEIFGPHGPMELEWFH